jgi:16S rRNA (guanine(966)-N(2))-methyltransferase RsmD
LQIIAGKYARRHLLTPKGKDITRPPLSRFRKAVFDTLMPFIPRGAYLDAFGGTGSFALEALSRGAAQATIIELDTDAAKLIQQNIAHLGITEPIEVLRGDAFQIIPSLPQETRYAIIGLAPPYNQGLERESLLLLDRCAHLLQEDGVLFVQHPKKEPLPIEDLRHLTFWKERHYGITAFSYFLPTNTGNPSI